MATPGWRLGLMGAVVLVGTALAAQVPPGAATSAPVPEPIPLPAEEGQPPSGRTIVLTEKEYEQLLEKIARLQGPPQADKADSPSSCKITGTISDDTAHLHLEFEFRTLQPNARVALGCAQGYPSKAEIDSHPPLLRWGPDGQFVQVAEPGDHRLLLEMELPLSSSRVAAGERGFELDLPAAATTVLEEFKFPPPVKKVRGQLTLRDGSPPRQIGREWNTEPADGAGGPRSAARIRTAGLGPVERLELTWKGPVSIRTGPPLLVAENGRVDVRVDERQINTTAELILAVRRGETDRWELLLPPRATVRPSEDPRVKAIERVDPQGRFVVQLHGPTADPLAVTVELQQPRSEEGIPVGPFVVVGAWPQRGEIFVSAPQDMLLRYLPRGESHYVLAQRELTEEEKRRTPNALALRYGVLTSPDKGQVPQLLDLDADRIRGVVEARLTHVLRLVTTETSPPTWHVTTTIAGEALHADIEELRVQLPQGFEFDDKFGLAPAGQFRGPDWVGETRRLAVITLVPRRKGAFSVSFEGRYTPPAADIRQGSLELPAVVGPLDRGGVITVVLPEELELIPARPGPFWDSGKREQYNRRSWTLDRMPARIDVAWQPYRPDFAVDGKILLSVAGRQATVQHLLWFAPSHAASRKSLLLRVPEGVDGLRVAAREERPPELKERTKELYEVSFLGASPDRDHPLTLEYFFRLPEPAGVPFRVPLVLPGEATRGETRVLVLTEPGIRPELDEGGWEQRLEEMKGMTRFPSLILVAQRPDVPLTLRLPQAAAAALAAFRVERVLLQAAVMESGQQTYRARYWLDRVATPHVDIELPAALFYAAKSPAVTVLYRGKVASWVPIDDNGRVTSSSKVGRVTLEPDTTAEPGVLEVRYPLSPGRIATSGTLHMMLQPPLLRGDVGLGSVRWQVQLPPSWVFLSEHGSLSCDYDWGWRGWLLGPQAGATPADLERWFAAGTPTAGEGNGPVDAAATVSGWAPTGEPLHILCVGQRAWLLLCSLGLLLAGVALGLMSLPRLAAWLLVFGLGAGAVLLWLFWPTLFAAVLYGIQPGFLVLLPFLAGHWLLQRRYHRQVVFLPSFARLQGSSITRGAGTRPRTEPSTVDVPPGSGSSPPPEAEGRQGKSEGDGARSGSSVKG